MRFIFYSPVAFEKWDYRNSVEEGIGGSETSHVEMAWRLARRGHQVITYAPLRKDTKRDWRGTKWYDIKKANFQLAGTWILYRCPEIVDKFKMRNTPFRNHQILWLMMQDWDYPSWTEQRIKNLDKVITLCQAHGRDVVRAHPSIGPKLWLTSNGVKTDLIEEIEAKYKVKRNPYKIIFASSPDRGLLHVIKSYLRAKEYVPELELHAFYGFNNLKKLLKGNKYSHFKPMVEETEELLKSPGVHWRGRVSQVELYKEWLSAGMWVYQTLFNETSCITSMEAQALGAIPIVNPIYALEENVRHGIGIDGDCWSDPLVKARFSSEIIRMATSGLQEKIRPAMMLEARTRFDWENFVDQWEAEALRKPYNRDFPVQLPKKKR